ncbi:MAG: RMD1 family protein [Hyphomicrobium sp.]
MPSPDLRPAFTARALQISERIDLKGLERADSFSKSPLAFPTPDGGTVVLFKSGAAVFIGLNPIEEEDIVRGLGERLTNPLAEREIEIIDVVINGEDDTVAPSGAVCLKDRAPFRLLLIAEVLAGAVSLSHDERRVGRAFDRVAHVAEGLKAGRLSSARQSEILTDIGEALTIQSRLAGRIGLDDKPDVLWEHPDLERFWMKLAEEFDLKSRANAIAQKLTVIRDSSETLGGLLSTRTSHRLEWYIIGLICFEIVLGLYDRFWK